MSYAAFFNCAYRWKNVVDRFLALESINSRFHLPWMVCSTRHITLSTKGKLNILYVTWLRTVYPKLCKPQLLVCSDDGDAAMRAFAEFVSTRSAEPPARVLSIFTSAGKWPL
eukprot:2295108-Pleurochrysis_carterae.AAC.6